MQSFTFVLLVAALAVANAGFLSTPAVSYAAAPAVYAPAVRTYASYAPRTYAYAARTAYAAPLTTYGGLGYTAAAPIASYGYNGLGYGYGGYAGYGYGGSYLY